MGPFGSHTRFDTTLAAPVITKIERAGLPGSEGVPAQTAVKITMAEDAPTGVVLSVRLLNANFGKVWSGSITAGREVVVGRRADEAKYVIVRYKRHAPDRRLGNDSRAFLLDPKTLPPLTFTAPPVLVYGPSGPQVGSTVGISGYTLNGTPDSPPTLELWSTENEGQNPQAYGTKVEGFVFGTTPIAADLTTRHLWGLVQATRGDESAFIWTEVSPLPVTGAPVTPETTLTADQVSIVGVFPKGGGDWQAVYHIPTSILDPSTFVGWDATTGLKIRGLLAQVTTPPDVMIENWQPFVPGDYEGLAAPKTTDINPIYRGDLGYYRLDERPDQTIKNAGGKWEKSYFLREGRVNDVSEPRGVLRLQVSKSGGANYGEIPDWYLKPNIPVTQPTTVVNVSTQAQLRAALVAAAPAGGITIRGAGGNYGDMPSLADVQFTSPVRIESATASAPMIFNGLGPILMTRCSNITFDRVHFIYTGVGSSKAIGMSSCNDITIQNCFFDGYWEQISIAKSNRVTVRANMMRDCLMDHIRVFFRNDTIVIDDNDMADPKLGDIGGQHRDFIQFATHPDNPGTDGLFGTTNCKIRRNILSNRTIPTVVGSSQYVQGIFVFSELLRVQAGNDYPAYGSHRFNAGAHRNFEITDNYIEGNFVSGIALGGIDGFVVERNKIVKAPAMAFDNGVKEITINYYTFTNAGGVAKNANGVVRNNVTPFAFKQTHTFEVAGGAWVNGAYTETGNVVSDSAWPTGWLWGAGNLPPAGPSAPPAPPVGLAGNYWKPLERTPAARASQPNNHGWGYQCVRCMMCCEDQPQYFVAGGDMNGIRLSEDGGKTWFHAESNGLRTPGFNSVWIDPVDRNVLLAMGNMVWWGSRSDLTPRSGIWRSTDFGKNWQFVQAMTNDALFDGHIQSLFTYDPATRALPTNQRRIYVFQRIGNAQVTPATGKQLWVSNNGGATWGKIGDQFNDSQFGGAIHRMQHHPTNGCLYIAGQNGVWKSNTDKTAWTRLAGGLPASYMIHIDISPSGTEMYAAGYIGAVYRSADSGATWTNIHAGPVRRMAVDWKSTPEIVHITYNRNHLSGSTYARNTSGNGTGPWTPQSQLIPALGWPLTDTYHTRNLSVAGGANAPGYDAVAVGAAGVFVLNAVARMFRTEDGGNIFRDCSWGYTGSNGQAFTPSQIAVRTDNPNYIAFPLQDTGCAISFDGMRSSLVSQVPFAPDVFAGFLRDPRSTYCIEWLPPAAGEPLGVILMGYGQSQRQGMVRGVVNSDQTVSWSAITSNAGAGLQCIRKHPTLNVVAGGQMISLDRGVTWSRWLNGNTIGVSRSGVLYLYRNDCKEIWRSSDWATRALAGQDPTYTRFYLAPSGNFNKFGYNGPTVRVSQSQENTIFIEGPQRDLVRVTNTGSSEASQVITPWGLSGLEGTRHNGETIEIADVCPDPRNPEMGYVSVFINGGQHLWRWLTVGGLPTWQNISLNAPKWQDCAMHVLPSGDVMIGSGVGPWCLRGPDGYAANYGAPASIWADLAQPVKIPAAT